MFKRRDHSIDSRFMNFHYKKRKVSVVRCVGHMATLVGTSGKPDGAGGSGHRGDGE